MNRTHQEPASGLSDNAAGAIAYITIIPAIIFLIVEPYNKNSFVRFHAWQSIFLGIACLRGLKSYWRSFRLSDGS